MHFLAAIPDFSRSCALLTDAEQVGTAVVFVHGFPGDPIKTWMHFQTPIDTTPDEIANWRGCDLYHRRFVALRDFAADLIRTELIVDHGRITRRMVDDRSAENTVYGDADDVEYLERFDPRAAVDEWRRESDAVIADWARRLGTTQQRGTPPALATARA